MKVAVLSKALGFDMSDYYFYEDKQKEEIMLGYLSGVDITQYNDVEIPYWSMNWMRRVLECGKNPHLVTYSEIHDEMESIDLRGREIELWKSRGVDLTCYNTDNYSKSHLRWIGIGLYLGYDVSLYDKEYLNEEQAEAIFEAIYKQIYVKDILDYSYAKRYNWTGNQLKTIFDLREMNIEVYKIINKMRTSREIQSLGYGVYRGIDMKDYVGYDSQCIDLIVDCIYEGYDVSELLQCGHNHKKMSKALNDMKAGKN